MKAKCARGVPYSNQKLLKEGALKGLSNRNNGVKLDNYMGLFLLSLEWAFIQGHLAHVIPTGYKYGRTRVTAIQLVDRGDAGSVVCKHIFSNNLGDNDCNRVSF